MNFMYTWVEAHQQIAQKLIDYRNRQIELIEILADAGVEMSSDQLQPGIPAPLTEIDPLTFFSYIYKHGTPRNKRVLRSVCQSLDIQVTVRDVCGVPSQDARNVWYFPYAYSRVNNELNRLWSFFEKMIAGTLNDNDFADVLSIQSVGKSKLLDGMFRIMPTKYLCLNGVVKPYILKHGITPDFDTYTELVSVQNRIRQQINDNFPELSYDALRAVEFSQREPNYFRIGTKTHPDGRSFLEQMLDNQIACIGWSEIGNLEDIQPLNKTTVKQLLLAKSYNTSKPTEDKKLASRKAGEILTFYGGMIPFDFILAVDGQTVKAIGKVSSTNYIFEPAIDMSHCRNVDWIKPDVNDLIIEEGKLTTVWQYEQPKTLETIRNYLVSISAEPIISKPRPPVEPDRVLKELPLNTILYGPPGTGKTWRTIDKAVEIINATEGNHDQNKEAFDRLREAGRIEFVTFHQNFSYEQFVWGIHPDTSNQQLRFKDKPGIFYNIAQKAKNAYDTAAPKKSADRYVLIIDEINRANISKVFGELITLLEEDKRIDGDNELTITLSNGEIFSLAPNLYIVGTMNTADKSIALIDVALRRRFFFEAQYPSASTLNQYYPERVIFMETLNRNIYQKRKNMDNLIGHAYLIKPDKMELIIMNKIIPLLMEYFSNRTEDVEALFTNTAYQLEFDTNIYTWKLTEKPVSVEASPNV